MKDCDQIPTLLDGIVADLRDMHARLSRMENIVAVMERRLTAFELSWRTWR